MVKDKNHPKHVLTLLISRIWFFFTSFKIFMITSISMLQTHKNPNRNICISQIGHLLWRPRNGNRIRLQFVSEVRKIVFAILKTDKRNSPGLILQISKSSFLPFIKILSRWNNFIPISVLFLHCLELKYKLQHGLQTRRNKLN